MVKFSTWLVNSLLVGHSFNYFNSKTVTIWAVTVITSFASNCLNILKVPYSIGVIVGRRHSRESINFITKRALTGKVLN